MDTPRLDHVNIRVPAGKLDTVRDFYAKAVELTPGERPPFPFPGCWLYAGQQPVLHLVELPAGREGAGPGAIDHFALAFRDYDAACDRLAALGIEYKATVVPARGESPGQRQLFIRDPLGNGVELNFPPAE